MTAQRMPPLCRTTDGRHAEAVTSGDRRQTSPPLRANPSRPHRQRGGFGVGLIVGLLIGLALALGVALYVTKVPVPFVNKVPQRSPAQDAAEVEKNKNWDPNSPLYGKNPARPSAVASGVVAPPAADTGAAAANPSAPMMPPLATVPAAPSLPASSARAAAVARASQPSTGRDPAAILADRVPPVRSAVDPTGNGSAGNDPFTYFVQAGAYGTPEDAEQQRARLAMMGIESRLSDRDQAGRTVHRVRLGPFDSKAEADSAKDKLNSAGIEAALVRVQR